MTFQVGSGGVTVTGRAPVEVGAIFYSSSQIACRLPNNISYSIDVTWGGQSLLQIPSFYFLSYDSVCYECDVQANTCDTLNVS